MMKATPLLVPQFDAPNDDDTMMDAYVAITGQRLYFLVEHSLPQI